MCGFLTRQGVNPSSSLSSSIGLHSFFLFVLQGTYSGDFSFDALGTLWKFVTCAIFFRHPVLPGPAVRLVQPACGMSGFWIRQLEIYAYMPLSSPKTRTYHRQSGRGAHRDGGAGLGRTGCRQNCLPRGQASLAPAKPAQTCPLMFLMKHKQTKSHLKRWKNTTGN